MNRAKTKKKWTGRKYESKYEKWGEEDQGREREREGKRVKERKPREV
jgi:hypothetical protein